MTARRSAADRLAIPGALLTRTDLRNLGLERRAIDAVFRALPVVLNPGYSRPKFKGDAVELDAIPPDKLISFVDDTITGLIDPGTWEKGRLVEESELKVLERVAGGQW